MASFDNNATTVANLWNKWKSARSEKEEIWMNLHRQYIQRSVNVGDYSANGYPWSCRVTRPIIQETVDTVSAAVKQSLFPLNEDFFEIVGDKEIGFRYEKFVRDWFRQKLFISRFTSRMEPMIKQTVLLGNSSVGTFWRNNSVERKRWQDWSMKSRTKKQFDYPVVEHHDIFSSVYNPTVTELDGVNTSIRRTVTTINDLKAKSHLYKNLSSISGTEKIFNDVTDSRRQDRKSVFGVNEGVELREGEVELLTLFGDLTVDGKLFRDHLVVIANRLIPIRFEPLPWWSNPISWARYSTVPGEGLGMGVAEPILGLARLIDTLSCQKVDIINLIVGGFWAVGQDGLGDFQDFISRPGGTVYLEDVNSVKSLTPSANPTLSFAEIDSLKGEIERSSAASSFAQGAVTPGRRSATEAIQIGQGASSRMNDITIRIGEESIEPALNIALQQEFQFNWRNKKLPREAWDGRYYVKFTGAREAAIREVRAQQITQFLGVVANSEALLNQINLGPLLREWLKVINLRSDDIVKEEVYKKDPQFNFADIGQAQAAGISDTGGQPNQIQPVVNGLGGLTN